MISSNLKNTLSWTLFLLFLAGLMFFADNIYQNQRCKKVRIELERQTEGDFITKTGIINLLTENGSKHLLDSKFNKLNFRDLESKILKNRLVETCQISRTLGGDLLVKVQQRNPIARIVAMGLDSERFGGLYLDEKGNLFPLSNNFTKKVVLLSGKYLVGKRNLKGKKDRNLLSFINSVVSDTFWNTNVTHIIIDADQNITFLPLVGDFRFEFGIPNDEEEDFAIKMKKIRIYYNQIEPGNSGKYKLISVKYKNQIVCQLNQAPTT